MVGDQQQRKGRWMKDEDKLLVSLVNEHSVDGEDIDWSILEQNFNGARDSKQIRERWVNHLNPSIKKRKFSDEEIKIIEEECSKHKFKWAKIAKKIPNATPLMIKNFYNNRLKKKNPARKLSNSNTNSYAGTYTINNFNTTTTHTHTPTPNIINPNLNNFNNNPNNYDNEYLQLDVSYYSDSNLSRNSSSRTDRTIVGSPGLSRNSSTRTNHSAKTMVEPTNFPTPSSSEFTKYIDPCKKADSHNRGLEILSAVADFVSTVSYNGHDAELLSPADPPIKPKKMSIQSIINC